MTDEKFVFPDSIRNIQMIKYIMNVVWAFRQ